MAAVKKPINPTLLPQPTNGITDTTGLLDYHGVLIGAATQQQYVDSLSRFMFPAQAYVFHEWATTHPTADPRTWVPLALGNIGPNTDVGKAVALSDVQNQIKSGTYGQQVGQPSSTPPGMALDTPAFRLPSLNVGSVVGGVYNGLKRFTRDTFTLFAAPWQAMQAAGREQAGYSKDVEDAKKALGTKYGLTPQEAEIAFAQSPSPGPGRPKMTFNLNDLSGSDLGVSDDRVSLMIQAQAEYLDQAKTGWQRVQEIPSQTTLGQVVAHPELDSVKVVATPGEMDWTTGQPGSTTYALQPEQGWLPSAEAQARQAQASAEVMDMRTADQVAANVAPIAWTPGRGLASLWSSPDSTAFNFTSGLADMTFMLAADPVNKIPVGFIGKGARAFAEGTRIMTPLGKAGAAGGSKIIVEGPEGIGAFARAGARAAVGEASRAGVPLVSEGVTPTTLARELGAIDNGVERFVVNRMAWDVLESGRGARIVNALVGQKSPYQIWLASNRKLDIEVAQALAEADTPLKVKAVIATRLGNEIASPTDFGAIGGRGPALFRNVLHTDVAGAQLDSGGIFTRTGREATAANFRQAGVAGAVAGLYRRPFRLAPVTQEGFDAENTQQAVEELDRFLRGVRQPTDAITPYVDRFIGARNGAERYSELFGQDGVIEQTVRKFLQEKDHLKDSDVHELTRAMAGGIDPEMRITVNRDMGSGVGALTEDGQIGQEILTSEMLSRNIHLPNYRALSRATGAMGRIRASGVGDAEDAVADFLYNLTSTWRNLVLMRPAYVLREVGEMAIAGSLAGYGGAITHPGVFLAMAHDIALAKEASSMSGRLLGAMAGVQPEKYLEDMGGKLIGTRRAIYRAAGLPAAMKEHVGFSLGLDGLYPGFNRQMARITGDGLWDQHNAFIRGEDVGQLADMFDGVNSVHGYFLMDAKTARIPNRWVRPLLRDNPTDRADYLNAFIDKMRIASLDADMRNLASDKTFAETLETFRSGTRSIKQTMNRAREGRITGDNSYLLLNSPEDDVAYLEMQARLLNRLTLGDEDLVTAIATRKYADLPLTADNQPLRFALSQFLDDADQAKSLPEVLHTIDTRPTGKLASVWNETAASERFFKNVGEMDDIFMRGPLIRQAYVKRVTELAPEMTPSAKAFAVKKLREAGDIELARKIQDINVGPGGTLGVDEIDNIASGFARKEQARIFYDAYKRQNYALALRTISPFAQATFNTFRRWGELSLRNPQMMYRTMRPLVALTQPGSASLYQAFGAATGDESMSQFYTPGHPEASVNGFFFTDSYGDRKFAYPLIGAIAGMLPGIEVPKGVQFVGSAAGLNIAGYSVNPGFGPTVTFPASMFLDNQIYQDNAQGAALRFLFPFDTPKGSIPEKIWGSFGPTAANKLMKATSPELNANTTLRMIAVLAATGDYDMTDPGDQRRLMNDATSLATRIGVFAALGGAVTPSTFSPQMAIAINGDQTGDYRRFLLQDRLYQEFKKYTAKDYNAGLMQFVQDYGTTALFGVLPMTKTRMDTVGSIASNDVWSFRTTDPQSYDEHAPVIGLFFKGGDLTQDFSANLYRWQKAKGERVPKTPEEFMDDVDSALGWMFYEQKNNEILTSGLPKDQQSVLRAQVKAELVDKYPGFTGQAKDLGQLTRRYDEMRSALKDEDIMKIPSAKYIKSYMEARDLAIESLQAKGHPGDLTIDAAKPERDWLLNQALTLVNQDTSGGFANAFTRLFSSDFPDQ